MCKTMGLYPNVIIGCDDNRLCIFGLESNSQLLLNIPSDRYSIEGNTITFYGDDDLDAGNIKKLVRNRLAYSLLRKPSMISLRSDNIHSCTVTDDYSLSRVVRGLYMLTFVLDHIESLPELHYPLVENNEIFFSSATLDSDRVSSILSKMQYVSHVRLLSNDILNTTIPFIPELDNRTLETIVDQSYYLSNYDAFLDFPKRLSLIVYLDNLERCDEIKSIPVGNNVSVSFFYRVKCLADLHKLESMRIYAIPYPSSDASEDVMHYVLDYSIDELLHRTISGRDLLLKNGVNPLFYGNVLVDNDGNIHSYPFSTHSSKSSEHFTQLKNNAFWSLKRSDFFEKCGNCALLGLCPPLSSYEINLRQTFCLSN